ncbi:MAG: aminotransferase class III-fold pyridoxal phosphate-dependent enzyme [Rhizobiales bacterium]|nr:aminotransferase class III-fold pyridoxal phosphate-dependent enzyme [Hyphomicrobiales bacterium]
MDWEHEYAAGLGHIWLPYAQMKTMRPPLAVARTAGCRIILADGRELVDGIASWWTACHGYNHPHIRQAVERQLAIMPHVMLGGLVHEQAALLIALDGHGHDRVDTALLKLLSQSDTG